jgi:thioesterase III
METRIKIRGYHLDLFQHVNNARYLEFLEEERWRMLQAQIDLDQFLKKYTLMMVHISASYIGQARMNDMVIVRSGLKTVGRKSFVFDQLVYNETTGRVCMEADVTFVAGDLTGKTLVVEGELGDVIRSIPPMEREIK